MKKINLDTYFYENLEDCINLISTEYSLKLKNKELNNISNFEDLITHLISKISFENINSCTKQQAFYKLRRCISETKGIVCQDIKLETPLREIYSSKYIYQEIKELERKLGFKIELVVPEEHILFCFYGIILFSILLLFVNLKISIISFILAAIILKLSYMYSTKINLNTVRELTIKITNNNYLKVRRQEKTVNKDELRDVFWHLFSENLDTDKIKLKEIAF